VYDDKILKLALALRRFVLTAVSEATETIHDPYNAVAVGHSFTGWLRESFCHLTVYPSSLFGIPSLCGTARSGILEVTGKQVRHVTIRGYSDLKNGYLRCLPRVAIR
jgi:hypothetical protein